MTNDSGLPESGPIAELWKLVEKWTREWKFYGPLTCANDLSDILAAYKPVPMSTCRDCGCRFESNPISPHLCEACQAGRGT